MKHYIYSGILDLIFSNQYFPNKLRSFETIVYLELTHEYSTHILPMMQHTCRQYLYRLQFIQANTDFGSFNRLMSPIPIPATEEEQRSRLPSPIYQSSAYGMAFPVDNSIQKLRTKPIITRPKIASDSVHPESRILLFLIRHDK